VENPRRSAPSRRTSPLPPGWQTRIRPPVLERDGHRCTWIEEDGTRCTATDALEVDHIGDPNDHTPGNLRTLCRYHHRKRTALQARSARGEAPPRRRPPEAHPGLIAKSDSPLDAARRRARQLPDIPPF
jgi:hypothetical protein